MGRLQQLHEAGVSIWLDTLSRELLESGEFERLVRESAVTGATSNPTIFAKAITKSDRYDAQLRELVARGSTIPMRFSSSSHSRTFAWRQSCFGPPTSEACGPMDSSRSSAPQTWPTTPIGTVEQALELWGRLDLPNSPDQGPRDRGGRHGR